MDVVDRRDIPMSDAGRRTGLSLEASAGGVVRSAGRGEDLDRYEPVQRHLPGQIDAGHATPPERTHDDQLRRELQGHELIQGRQILLAPAPGHDRGRAVHRVSATANQLSSGKFSR